MIRTFTFFSFLLVLASGLARAQYSDESFENKKASELYDERGFYQNKAITVDGKLVVSNSNGNVSYSYPISSWQRHGHSFSSSLNYCGSVSFTTYGEYETGGVDNPYTKWNRFSQNRPVWLLGVNGFAVQAISLATAFHAQPDVIDNRFDNSSVTSFDDGDFVWTIDGYDISNRMQNFAEGDYDEDPSQNGGNPRYVYRDVIKLLRADGSVLELLNVNDAGTNVGASSTWGVCDHLYSGYYVVNEANHPGYAWVEFQDSAASIPTYLWDYLPDAPKYRARVVHYYPGDGLEYVFSERFNPFGMADQRDPGVRFGGAVANPTMFYLFEIRSSSSSLLQCEYSRHGINWDYSGAFQANAFWDSTMGRALLTSFGDNHIAYGNSGLTITSFGRSVKVFFDTIAYSGNSDPDAEFPLASLGYLSPTSEAVAKLPLNSESQYRSWTGYITKIVDPEGRETRFDYEQYTRTHRDFGFPRSSGAQTIDVTLNNYRLKEVVEPSAKYTITYRNRSGAIEVLDVDTADVMIVTQGAAGNYPHAFSNAARHVEKRNLGGTLLSTDRYTFEFEGLPGAPATTPKTAWVVSKDEVTGRTDSIIYHFSREKLPRSIRKEPDRYYTKMSPVEKFSVLNGVVENSSSTVTTYTGVAPYLWLPTAEFQYADGFLKAKNTLSYQLDTVRRYGDDDTLIKYHGMELAMKVTDAQLPNTGTYLLDTVEFLNVPEYDTALVVVVNDTIFDKFAMYRKYDSLRFQAFDSAALHTPYRFMMYDPRVYTVLEVRVDTVDGGEYRMLPMFGLVRRQWTSDASGNYLQGKSNYYCLFGDCDGGPGTTYWYGKLGLRGSLLSDTVFGRGRQRSVLAGKYDYFTPGLVSTAENRFGAISTNWYSRSHPKAWQAGGQFGTVLANDDQEYIRPLRDGSYFAGLTGQPTATYQQVRHYTPAGTLVRDTLHTMFERTYYGLAAATVEPNGYLSEFDYDYNGRLNTAWLPYDFQSPDSIYYLDVTGMEVSGGHGSSAWFRTERLEKYTNDGNCTPVDTTITYNEFYEFGDFMVNKPINIIPQCDGSYDTVGTREKAGPQVLSFYKEIFYETQTPAIGELRLILSGTPMGQILDLDSAFLQVDISSIVGECVVLNVTIPEYETFSKSYVLNCGSATGGGGGGIGSSIGSPVDGYRYGDPDKSGAMLLSGGDTVNSIVRLKIPLGDYCDSIVNDDLVIFRFETTTSGAEVRFINGIFADDDTRPQLLLYGDFRKRNPLYDYTLHYEHDDENLKSEIWAKVDDSAHTANRGVGGAAMLGESRRTMVEHTFGADYRLLKSRTMMGDPESPYRVDSILAEYSGFGQTLKATDQEGDTVSTLFDAMARPIKNWNQDGTFSTTAWYTTDDQVLDLGISTSDQDFYGFVQIKVTTNEIGTKFAEYYDARDQLRLQIADSGGLHRKTKYEYDVLGRVRQVVNPANDTTLYWYDDLGRVRYKRQPDLGTLSFAYDDLGNVRFAQTQEQHDDERVTFNEYDDLSRLVLVGEASFAEVPGGGGGGEHGTSPDPEEGKERGMALGRGVAGEAPLKSIGSTSEKSGPMLLSGPVDDTLNLGRWTDQLDPNYLHDSGFSAILTANKTLWTDPATYGKTVPTFWPLGSLTKIPSCTTFTSIRPDAVGPFLRHPAVTYTPIDVQSLPEDFENLAKYPENARIAISYDTLPELAGPVWGAFPAHSQWDALAPEGLIRNMRGREAAVAYREHSGQPYHYSVLSYDERGRVEALIRYTENLGFDAVYYDYNSMNQVIRVTVNDPLRRYSTWYGYDNNGRVDSVWTKLDGLGRGLWTTGTGVWAYSSYPLTRPNDAEITYVYTKTGQVDTMAYPKISVVTDYQYNSRKWLDTLIATKSGSDLFTQFLTFDDAGQITRQVSEHGTSGDLIQDYGYDALGQLTSWRKDSGAAGDYGEDYAYDTVGNRTSVQYKPGGGISGWTNNDIGRHLGLSSGPNQLKEAKQYDLFGTYQGGTLYFYDADGAQTTRMQLDASQVPHLYEDFTYSSWRGLPWTYTRTDPNMPPGMENEWSWEYRYNAMGEREQKREVLTPEGDDVAAEGYDWTYYLLSGNRKQLSVWKGLQTSDPTFCSMPGGGGSYVHLYPGEYLTYSGSNVSITQKLDNTREYRIADHLGTNRVVVNNSGTVLSTADYEPFGKPLSGSIEDRLSWIDKERDAENGYGNFGVRAYDYDMGRFTSIDPLWEVYRGWNPYQYSANNAMLFIDPTGSLIEFTTEEDRQAFMAALEYLESKGVEQAQYLRDLLEDENFTMYLQRTDGSGLFNGVAQNEWRGGVEQTLYWHSTAGFEYPDEKGEKQRISPAVVLLHEATHAWLEYYESRKKMKLQRQTVEGGNGEEMYIIENVEGPAAIQTGEVEAPRVKHGDGLNFKTSGVTSNEPLENDSVE